MSKTVCLIPARGGSKRILGKNIKPFLGKPIITYPIETAKASGIFDDIIVYTDDTKIGQVALNNQVIVMQRDSVSDIQTMTEVALEFIEQYQKTVIRDSIWIDYLCILLPTAVFIDKHNIIPTALAITTFNDSDAYITFCKYSHPISRAFAYMENKFVMMHQENQFKNTSELPVTYYDAGQMYFLNVKSFLKQKKIFMDNVYPIIIDAVDIDNPEDWKKAEAFYKVIHE
jgi:pseudaminic acid cytidylyltransferase